MIQCSKARAPGAHGKHKPKPCCFLCKLFSWNVLSGVCVSSSEASQNSSHLLGHSVSRAAVTNPHEGQIRTKSKKSSRKILVFRALLVPKASLYISLLQWGAFPLRHFHVCSSNKKLHANPWSQAESLLTFTSIHMPLSYLTTKHIQTTTQPSTARG